MTAESWVGWYRDRAGTEALTISTDGQRLHARIRGCDFTGEDFTGLYPDSQVPPEGPGFTLAPQGALCGCVLEWDIPMPVYDAGVVHRAVLRCLLTLGRPVPVSDSGSPGLDRLHLGLALHFDGALYASGHAENDFAGALAEIQRQLPPGAYLKSCLSCAFSDYAPTTAVGFFGSLACFREAKESYRTAGADVLGVWDLNSGPVQETHRCPDFELRPAAGLGHRGAFPPPRTELIHVQGDFRPPQAPASTA
ncbi:DUF6304 family protein [Streptomyces candidus]|uniref:Uncharacterized protein n=1 Tax=Streptomyces candidus TaxID=67283 RepID=A0A7X0HH69_9ACTN|nr:DUF6304 family protein [Streptomyces candidus]MBB6437501.1 hypothetical protein [Streptomyces candidus]